MATETQQRDAEVLLQRVVELAERQLRHGTVFGSPHGYNDAGQRVRAEVAQTILAAAGVGRIASLAEQRTVEYGEHLEGCNRIHSASLSCFILADGVAGRTQNKAATG